MFELEPVLCSFEKLCGCRLTLHDHHHVLANPDGTPMFEQQRNSHRKTYSACSQVSRQYCIEHCMFKFNAEAERTRTRCRIDHCRAGNIEVAVPVFRNGRHVLSIFAGFWKSPLSEAERIRIRELCRLLPVFADGLLVQAEQYRIAVPGHAVQKEKIRSFIAGNFNRAVSTADLAGFLSLSVVRTCHVVRKTFGKSFSELLTDERLNHAELFLKQTDYRIGEIAELCGFQNPEHFSRTFHRRNGMSPGQFRKSADRGGRLEKSVGP